MHLATLTITRWGLGVEFAWDNAGGASHVWNSELPAEVLPWAMQLRQQLHDLRWAIPTQARTLLCSLGVALGNAIPAELQGLLAEPAGAPLALRTEDAEMPWESALLGNRFLWQCRSLFRAEGGCPRAEGATTKGESSGSRISILADPDGLAPWVRDEGSAVAGMLSNWKTELHVGAAVSQGRLRRLLGARDSALLYLAALAEIGPPSYQRSQCRLFLADGPVTFLELRALIEGPWPPLLYLNLYSAGPPLSGIRLRDRFDSWARLFFDLGAQCVVGPLWDLPPAISRELGLLFFDRLARGDTALEAVQAARTGLREDDYLARHSLALLGDPAARLPSLSDGLGATMRGQLQAEYALEVLAGPEKGREILLYAESLKMGKAIQIGSPGLQVNDIELQDAQLDNRACSLELTSEGLVVSRTGSAGSLTLNGLNVLGKTAFSPGDVLEMGLTQLRLGQPRSRSDASSAQEPGAFLLVVEKGVPEDEGRLFLLERGVTVVGRLADCTVRLCDPAVSRHHVSILFKDGFFLATHVGSTQTIINGVPLEDTRELQPDDVLQLSGKTFLRFCSSRRRAGD